MKGRVDEARRNQKNEPRARDQYSRLFEQFTEDLCGYQVCDYRPSALAIFNELPNLVKASDRRIAAIAIDYGLVLITSDAADFPRLNRSDLIVEDWTIDQDIDIEDWVEGTVDH